MASEPFDIELEQALLGAILVNNDLIDIAAAELDISDFYEPLHQRIFDAAVYLKTEGDVNPLILHAVLRADASLIEVGGMAYLAGLAGAAPAMPNLPAAIRILKDLALRRALGGIALQINESVAKDVMEMPSRAVAETAIEALLRLGRQGGRPIISPYEAAMQSLRDVEAMKSNAPARAVTSGLRLLDEETGGFRGGDLVVIAGKSGMGKSGLMGGIGLRAAMAGHPVIVFSLEMTRQQWVERIICDLDYDVSSKILHYSQFRTGKIRDDEFARAGSAAGMLHGLPIEIQDDDSLSIGQISARARAFQSRHREGKKGIVIIDYLQIAGSENRRDRNREQEVAEIARGAKALAKRLDWPVIAGSQVNENDAARGKDEKRPQAGDVRESKAIRNEADFVLMPWREAYFLDATRPPGGPHDPAWPVWESTYNGCKNRLDLIGAKNRHGRPFEIRLYCEIGANAIRDQEPARARMDDEIVTGLLARA